VVVLQFPEDYPNHEVLVELRSKTLDDKLLNGLTRVCEERAREYLGTKTYSFSEHFRIIMVVLYLIEADSDFVI
jgi:hypothetical protein